MKIRITNEAKQWMTLAEAPEAKKIIEQYKEYDKESTMWYAEAAARVASGENAGWEILKQVFEIAGNSRANGYYSGRLDIWMECYVFNSYEGFYAIGAYVSDLEQLASDNREEIKSHMWIRAYKKGEPKCGM